MKLSLHNKLVLKGLFHSLLQLLCILLFGIFNKCLFEILIVYICFFTFRPTFEKQFHALTSWGCTYVTITVYYIVSLIVPNKSVTLLLTIIFTYFINYASYLYKDHLDNMDLNNIKNNCKTKKNSKRKQIIEILGINNLDEESIEKFCVSKSIPFLSETIYLFLNNKLEDVADILQVDMSTLNRRINKFINISKIKD